MFNKYARMRKLKAQYLFFFSYFRNEGKYTCCLGEYCNGSLKFERIQVSNLYHLCISKIVYIFLLIFQEQSQVHVIDVRIYVYIYIVSVTHISFAIDKSSRTHWMSPFTAAICAHETFYLRKTGSKDGQCLLMRI